MEVRSNDDWLFLLEDFLQVFLSFLVLNVNVDFLPLFFLIVTSQYRYLAPFRKKQLTFLHIKSEAHRTVENVLFVLQYEIDYFLLCC